MSKAPHNTRDLSSAILPTIVMILERKKGAPSFLSELHGGTNDITNSKGSSKYHREHHYLLMPHKLLETGHSKTIMKI
jgi:hypothetical protein